MKITFHLGAHATDDNRLMRSLMANADLLAREGIYVPGPSRFRTALRDVVTSLRGQPASADISEMLLDTILDSTEARHVILSNDAFLCGASMIMAGGGYYARADRSAWLRNLFPEHEVAFALAIRNPATHVAAVLKGLRDHSLDDFLQGVSPEALRWSQPVAAIRAANPGTELVIWSNEDTPLLWPRLMRRISGYRGEAPLGGDLDMAGTLLGSKAARTLRKQLAADPPADATAWKAAVSDFLARNVDEEALVQEIDLPGWDARLVARMTADYEADARNLHGFPGVEFLDP